MICPYVNLLPSHAVSKTPPHPQFLHTEYLLRPTAHKPSVVVERAPMGVTRKIISPGNGSDFPTKGDKVGVEHIVYHHDGTKSDEDFKGEQ